jgi:Clp amino terminal domain, pathogenicity island component
MLKRLMRLIQKTEFSESALKVLASAAEEAKTTGRKDVASEHILIGLVTVNTPASQHLKDYGVRLGNVKSKVEQITGPAEATTSLELDFSPTARIIVDQSVREAKHSESKLVEPEHILLALLHNARGVASKVLEELAVDFNKLECSITDGAGVPCGFISNRDFRRGLAITDGVHRDILIRHDRIVGKRKRDLVEVFGSPDHETKERLVYNVCYLGDKDTVRFTIFLSDNTATGYELIRTQGLSGDHV